MIIQRDHGTHFRLEIVVLAFHRRRHQATQPEVVAAHEIIVPGDTTEHVQHVLPHMVPALFLEDINYVSRVMHPTGLVECWTVARLLRSTQEGADHAPSR
jgi:hypothetical protein